MQRCCKCWGNSLQIFMCRIGAILKKCSLCLLSSAGFSDLLLFTFVLVSCSCFCLARDTCLFITKIVYCRATPLPNCSDRSVVDRFVYTEKVGGSKPSRNILDESDFFFLPVGARPQHYSRHGQFDILFYQVTIDIILSELNCN